MSSALPCPVADGDAGDDSMSASRVAPLRAHLCFRLDAKVPLDLSAEDEPETLWRCLSYRVLRQPDDLLAHARRVLICRHHGGLRPRLPAALQDLDHAAGPRGDALRRRLLVATRRWLPAEHVLWLEARLDGTGGSPPPPCEGRVLPALASGRHALVDAATRPR